MPNLDSCEVCGREAHRLEKRKIEGVIMDVCQDCQDLGEPVVQRRRNVNRNVSHGQNTQRFQSMYKGGSSGNRSSGSRPKTSSYTHAPKKKKKNIYDMKLVDDYQKILLKCRTANGLSSREFAGSLQIKENYYKRIEKGTTGLQIELAQKIERKYKIKLIMEDETLDETELDGFMNKSKSQGESMVYFRKRGQKPEY